MNQAIPLQQAIEYIESLSLDEQDLLLELIHKRRIEKRRGEIAQNAVQTLAAVETGTAKQGKFNDLKADLINDL